MNKLVIIERSVAVLSFVSLFSSFFIMFFLSTFLNSLMLVMLVMILFFIAFVSAIYYVIIIRYTDDLNYIELELKPDDTFEISSSNKKEIIVDGLVIISMTEFLTFGATFLIIQYKPLNSYFISWIIFIIIVMQILPVFFIQAISKNTLPRSEKFLISTNKIEIFLHDKLFFKTSWENLEKIEIIKVRFTTIVGRGSTIKRFSRKIKFIGKDFSKVFGLWCFNLHRKERNQFLSVLKEFADILNKPFLEIPNKKKDLNLEDSKKTCFEIEKFVKDILKSTH